MNKRIVLWSMMLMLCLCGCTKQEAATDTESTLYINSDGTIDSLIVEDFPEDEYSAEELLETTKDLIAMYDKEHGFGKIKLESCEVSEGTAYVKLSYKSAQDYAAFNRTELFYGTVREGLDAGYAKKTTLKNAYGSNMLSGDAIADLASYHMIVVTEQVQIKTGQSVLYYSANLEPVDDKTMKVSTESNGEAVIITK